MIRIDALWLCTQPLDMRAGAERLLAAVVQTVGAAHPHHGYVFANARHAHQAARARRLRRVVRRAAAQRRALRLGAGCLGYALNRPDFREGRLA